MNKVIIEMTNCQDCKYCEHNGLLQDNASIRYVCHHNKMYNSKLQDGRKKWNNVNGIDYWYGLPILAKYNSKSGKQIDIPNWCPRLKTKENTNETI